MVQLVERPHPVSSQDLSQQHLTVNIAVIKKKINLFFFSFTDTYAHRQQYYHNKEKKKEKQQQQEEKPNEV